MVKTKKGKKEILTPAESGSSGDEHDANPEMDSDNDKVSSNNKKNQKAKKSTKKSPLEGSDEAGDVSKAVKKVAAKGKGKSKAQVIDDESFEEPVKNSAFDLLVEDDDNDQVPADDDNGSEREDEAVKPQKHEKKSKKSKRKGKDEDDAYLDKMLAELQAEYAGEAPTAAPDAEIEEPSKKTKKSKKQQQQAVSVEEANEKGDDDNELECDGSESTMKTAAQKKKEKKERQKREAALSKQRAFQAEDKQKSVPVAVSEPEPEQVTNEEIQPDVDGAEEVDENSKAAKNKKKGKKEKKTEADEEKKDTKKKGMSSAIVAAMQEQLRKRKEEEERLQKAEEERMRLEDEREEARLEAVRLEAEKKEKKKQKEAERKARLKAEGKLLTKKQKEDRARAQALLDSLKAQGLEIPDPSDRRAPRPGTRIRPNKKKNAKDEAASEEDAQQAANAKSEIEIKEQTSTEEVVKESWDASDSDGEPDEESQGTNATPNNDEQDTDEDDSDSESSSDDSDEAEESEKEDVALANDPESRRLRAEARILKRQADAEKKCTTDELRAAVVCVLGHVDTGKTKILDKLRRTHVQDSEAGGITQQIGATNVPIDAIKEQTKYVKNTAGFEHRLPGLLIIDTPGHESFSNLRNRGSSLCDIAILVVDIMHGLEPQTIESIQLLKKKRCPFIVALNKIDRLYDWKVLARRDVRDVIKEQQTNTQLEFQQRSKEVMLQFAEQGLNAALFYDNPDPKTYISLVPTSAITGEGMGNLLFMITDFCQNMLAKRLMYSEELQATVLEVKAIPGLGTTIDAILMNGKLREGQTMILAGTDGPITTQIRSLLMPQPMKELRVKNAYIEYKEVKAAQGVKIAAKDLEKAIAGINLLIAHKPDEIEICKDEVARELKSALSHIKLAQSGVYVQASTLGSLEALLEFLRTSKIPYSAIRIGPVVKRDVMKASTMLEHEAQYATILAFDVKVEREAQEMADTLGVKIFQADIIYHLFDKFTAYREELKQKKREEFRSIAVFPCKLKILPQFIFNSRDPIVMGVMVENGIVKVGTPICVPSKEFVDIGVVTSIELNHKQLDSARKGQEICIKIEPIPGESPKMFGRHFEAEDMLISKITRQSIDACKDYFRDDLIKADWALMVELKKLFEIL
ncbi:eukaryotic translation initiation factor 5B isoform X2 [Drosophila busckii]|uniref:eukaryotic translation initiation factor 5B isoform X2 n=1 Tax=Drosophila busckii TaxID=30019 RepID=UPI00083F13F4|nr:eukaryotic translation initiation factor 5B isoform X2 [Drosophila busckii]